VRARESESESERERERESQPLEFMRTSQEKKNLYRYVLASKMADSAVIRKCFVGVYTKI